MQVFWKTSLFLYEVLEPGITTRSQTPIIVFWRATAFTFGRAAGKATLKRAIREISETGDLIESKSKKVSWEKRQVSASDSKGLGFGWIELSRGEKKGILLQPEERRAVWNLYALEKSNFRLGYTEFFGKARQYGADKRVRLLVGRAVKSFWEWLTH